MGVKLGLLYWGKDTDWVYSCWERYVGLGRR